MGHRFFPVLACLLLVACPDAPGNSVEVREGCAAGQTWRIDLAACVPVGPTCEGAFEADASGWGCVPILPETPCPVGSMAQLGSRACVPVGVPACGEGFERDASGWGCAPILAEGPCTGATRRALGQRVCVPLGSCAPGPPEGALVVDDDGAPGPGRYASLTEAIAAAPAGSTLFVEAGHYRETVVVEKNLTIQGRCAEEVVIEPGASAEHGMGVRGPVTVRLSGLTVRGFDVGVQLERGAQVQLEAMRLEANLTTGMFVFDEGTFVQLSGSVVRETLRTAEGRFGQGVAVGFGGRILVEDSELTDNGDAAILVASEGSEGTVRASILADSRARSDGKLGFGGWVQDPSLLRIEGSAILGNRGCGIIAGRAQARAELSNSVVSGTGVGRDAAGVPMASGACASEQGTVAAVGTTFAGNDNYGVVSIGSRVELDQVSVLRQRPIPGDPEAGGLFLEGAAGLVTRSAFVGNPGFGIVVTRAESLLELEDVLVLDTVLLGSLARSLALAGGAAARVNRTTLAGSGAEGAVVEGPFSATGLIVSDSASFGFVGIESSEVSLEDLLLMGNGGAGLSVQGPAAVSVARGVIQDTGPDALDDGYGAAVWEHGTLDLVDVTLRRNGGLGLLASDPGTRLEGTRIAVLDTQPSAGGERGRGVVVQRGASARVRSSAVVGNHQIGVLAVLGAARVDLEESFIGQTRLDAGGLYGDGVAILEAEGRIVRSEVRANRRAGVVVAAGRCGITQSVLAGNEVGLHAQDDSRVEEVGSVPEQLGRYQVAVDRDTAFADNASKTGTGQLALPEP